MALTIEQLKRGAIIADDDGTLGKVLRFTQNHVYILWDDMSGESRYTDADLAVRGVVLVKEAL